MMSRVVIVPAGLAALLGCGSGERPGAGSGDGSGHDGAWVGAGGGLEVRLDLPSRVARGERTVVATLRFRNTGTAPVRIYFLGPEPFRGPQSALVAQVPGTRAPVSLSPEALPHGYLPAEEDFPMMRPGEELVRAQSIELDPTRVPAGARELAVTWRYQNQVTSWPGGVQTLDGPTKPLFGGGPIPHVWTGQVEARAKLRIGDT